MSEALTEANYYHNNQKHSSTGYKRIEIKNTKDEAVIKLIKKREISWNKKFPNQIDFYYIMVINFY